MIDAFRDPFMQHAVVGSVVVAVACAYVGVFVVLRRVVFVGAALAQVSTAGVGLALLLGLNPSALSLGLALVGVALFSVRPRGGKITQESQIGIGFALASAMAVLFVARNPQGESHMLDVLSGNVLTITVGQIATMSGVAVTALVLLMLFRKQLLFSTFDPETAQSVGIRSSSWDLLFFLVMGVVIAFSIRLAGTLVTFGFLVLPAVTALSLSQNLGKIVISSIIVAALAAVLGLYASFAWDLPSGPSIVLASFVLYVAAVGISKRRGK